MDTQTSNPNLRQVRKHISSACTACRDRKSKCDGRQPKCSRCLKTHKQCVYQLEADKRRTPPKRVIEIYADRIKELEDIITGHGLQLPENDDVPVLVASQSGDGGKQGDDVSPHETGNDTTYLPEEDDTQGQYQMVEVDVDGLDLVQTSLPIPDQLSSLHPGSLQRPIDQESSYRGVPPSQGEQYDFESPDWFFDFSGLGSLTPGIVGCPHPAALPGIQQDSSVGISTFVAEDNVQSPAVGNSHIDITITGVGGHDSEDDEDDDAQDVIAQLSDRMGTLNVADDGEMRFFGATSNFHLLKSSTPCHPSSRQSTHDYAQAQLNHGGFGQPVDPSVEEHLIKLFFTWQDACYHVVDEDIYNRERNLCIEAQRDSAFYSPTLTNAMCAMGALLNDQTYPDLPRNLAEMFAEKARILLQVELGFPRVVTVQSLVILSSYGAASNRDAMGWLYSGMSMRLSFDLGLHIDMGPYVREGKITKEEAKVRKMAFWGSYIIDHAWGFYLGRPFNMNMANITVAKPASDVNESSTRPWKPYGLSEAVHKNITLENPIEMITKQWVLLCEIMEGVGDTIYGCVGVSNEKLRTVTEQTVSKLQTWKNNLPPDLDIDVDNPEQQSLPHLFLLHMQYHQILIHTHRPFISKHSAQPTGVPHSHARLACIESAVAISKLLCLYTHNYTLRKINIQAVSITFTASLILLFATLTAFPVYDRGILASHLDTCCSALAELGNPYELATRTLDALLAIKRRWQARVITHTGFKRRNAKSVPATAKKPRV